MIKTLIIEDEKIITEQFRNLLKRASTETEIVGTLSTVKESVAYFSQNESPDLVFSDVQLADGLSFDIFNQVPVKCPVVFVTGFDQFIMNAFEYNGIDYLLKPVDERDLGKTLAKYRTLEKHFTQHAFIRSITGRRKTRLLVSKGTETVPLKMEDVALIYTENKIVYVVDKDGRKYMLDRYLAELEKELDPTIFFRVNRQYIVNIAFIKSYKTYEKVKLLIDLSMPDLNHRIIISQEMAPDFRRWISGL